MEMVFPGKGAARIELSLNVFEKERHGKMTGKGMKLSGFEDLGFLIANVPTIMLGSSIFVLKGRTAHL